ncbi:MAG: Dyp-type peroxidase [Planctomycetes bacterium]|nr:Dyp-type peroxidase [Planctomycetota bacterium]
MARRKTAPADNPAGASNPAPKPRPVAEPLLDVHDMQGNILAGFKKDHQHLIALKIRGIPEARRWLARVLPHISSLAEVHQFNALFKMRRARLNRDPHGLAATWMNLAFSHDGIAKLASADDADALPDDSFRLGLGKERSEFLGDPLPAGQTDPTAKWFVGGTGRAPDIFLIVASDCPKQLALEVERIRPGAADGPDAPEPIWDERGETRTAQPGHEHFGFRDGVSQPGVRGLISRSPKMYLTPRVLKPPVDGSPEFAKPGQPLVWPGHFVLGYPFGDRRDGSRQDSVPLARPWFKNGSFLVFRRLNQNVAGFTAFVAAAAAKLAAEPGFDGLTPAHLGALLVGRWPSGAPVSRAPALDNPALAKDGLSNNDFLFTVDTPPPDFLPRSGASPGAFPRALESLNGPVCPHAAHIFKVNPRDHVTDVGNEFDTLTRRILRRGIPFGPSLADPLNGDDGVERGLHFLCYQASIVDQFEFLQQDWTNNRAVPPTANGHDLIIGQSPTLERSITLSPIVPGAAGQTVTAPTQWVTPTGGGYFFAPSISAIRNVLCRQDGQP